MKDDSVNGWDLTREVRAATTKEKASVVVETEAGERHERFVRYPKGDPENPLTWDELAAKFLALAGPVVGPDRCIEICKRYEAVGCQLLFCLLNPYNIPHEDVMTSIELLGKHVIPKIDKDPVHRTTRLREAAAGTNAK